jgi:cupin 2 domain-containing protein
VEPLLDRSVNPNAEIRSCTRYDQDEAEWVVVLRGSAKLFVEGAPDPLHMSAGDHLLIPAHSKHRVEWTTPDEPTIWLAVFFADEPSRADL